MSNLGGSSDLSMIEQLRHYRRTSRPTSAPLAHGFNKRKLRMIVGIDYGTTFSGVSYVTNDKAGLDEINLITNWPGRPGECKTPTRIAYKSENQDLTEDLWGYKANASLISCSWTKLQLDNDSKEDEHDDPHLKEAASNVDGAIFHVPREKKPADVCEDYLRHLYEFFVKRLQEKGTNLLVFNQTPMDCYITVPAVWSERARALTLKAAKAAGFGNREGDTMQLIPEPEAAALTVLKSAIEENLHPPKTGENFLVCDCGGGTVDINTYKIVDTSPNLEFDELCTGKGGKCGSTYLDREMLKLLESRFGAAFQKVPVKSRGPGSPFMESWESAKRDYSGGDGNDTRSYRLVPLRLDGNFLVQYYDESEVTVILSKRDMKEIFSPVITRIIKLLGEQMLDVGREQQSIQRLILIGGFGESPYLLAQLRSWCKTNYPKTQVYGAEHSQAAIVKGAALRGLLGTAPRKRRCRRHYGIEMWLPFRDGIDPESRTVYNTWDKAKCCSGRVKWLIGKGEVVENGTRREASMYIDPRKGERTVCDVLLYSCALETPQDYASGDRVQQVGRIAVEFSEDELSSFEHKRYHSWKSFKGIKVYRLDFQITIDFGGQAGLLEVRSLVHGQETGRTTIDFE